MNKSNRDLLSSKYTIDKSADDLKRLHNYPSAQTIISEARNEVFKSKELNKNSWSDKELELPQAIKENENEIVSMFKQLNKDILPEMDKIIQKERMQKRDVSQKGFKQIQQSLR